MSGCRLSPSLVAFRMEGDVTVSPHNPSVFSFEQVIVEPTS
jgi:hypothetical protein